MVGSRWQVAGGRWQVASGRRQVAGGGWRVARDVCYMVVQFIIFGNVLL